MLEPMIAEAQRRFFGRFLEDIFGYWRIYDWVKLRVRHQIDHEATVSDESSFWHSILGDTFAGDPPSCRERLDHGQPVVLRDFFLTDWIPKLPGQAWTSEAVEQLQLRDANVDIWMVDNSLRKVLDPFGKEEVLSAGWGSIRLCPELLNPGSHILLNAITERHWFTDKGIPIVASQQVYREYVSRAKRGAPWIREAHGRVYVGVKPLVEASIPSAIGARLRPELHAALLSRPHLPYAFVLLESPLDVKLAYNDSHPPAIAWSVYETESSPTGIGFTYSEMQPESEESIRDAATFLGWYAKAYGTGELLTDFDGRVPRLESTVDLRSNPLGDQAALQTLARILDLLAGGYLKVAQILERADSRRPGAS